MTHSNARAPSQNSPNVNEAVGFTGAQANLHPPANADGHPQQSRIEIASLTINPTTDAGIGQQQPDVSASVFKLFRTDYFRLFTPLDTWEEKCVLIAAIILALAAGVPLPIIGVIFGKIINGFPPTENDLRNKLVQLIGVAIAYFFVTWGWATCWGVVGEKTSRKFREVVLRKVIGMDVAYFEVECPDIAHRLTADTQTIQLGTSEKCGLFLQSIAYFIAAFVTGFVLNARLTGILFVAIIPPMAVVVIYGSFLVSKFAKLAHDQNARATSVVEGAIKAVQVVQAFGALEVLAQQHLKLMGPAVRLGIHKAISGAAMLGMVYFIAYAANSLAFWEGSRLIASGGSYSGQGAGTVYTVIFLILDASFVIGQFGPFLQTFSLAAAAGDNVLKILDRPEPNINVYSEKGQELPSGGDKFDITLSNITFAYPARPGVKIMDGLSIKFEAGKFHAIVGSSGSGKSTIASLLLRFYDPISGSIEVGGLDLKTLNLKSYRSRVALVDQDSILFSGSVMDNIRYGLMHMGGLSPEEVTKRCIQAAKDSNAYDFISRLPNGFDTKIGGTGATQLSGGQRQRLALARAIVGDPAIMILDEPTSALDATSEVSVLEALNNPAVTAGRTTIMIAHRLATVRGADNIIVMSNGKLVEEGTHEELVIKGGAYRELVEAQRLYQSSSSVSSLDTKVGEIEERPKEIDTDPYLFKSKVLEEEVDEVPLTATLVPENSYTVGALIRRCFEVSKPDVPFICLGLLASLITGGIITGESIIFGNMVSVLNDKSDPERLKSQAAFFALMFFILSLIALLAYIFSGSSFGVVSERLIRRIRDISLRTILRQDISWFDSPKHSPAHLVSTINMDTGHLSGLSGIILGTIFTVIVSMTGGIILAHVVAWRVAVVILAAVPVMILSGFLRIRILSKFEQRHQTAYLEAAALATEACNAIRTIAALGREKDIINMYHEAIDGPYQESMKFIVNGNLWLAFALSITYFVYALAYWWGGKQTREGNCTPLQFFIVLPALLFSAQASGQMFSLAPEVTRAKAAAMSVFSLHDQKPTIDRYDSYRSIHEPQLVKTAIKSTGKVEFRDVKFRYASRSDIPVLRGISLKIEPGQFIAFVGSSGAGKSSAIALLERFYDPISGSILVDDKDIKGMDVQEHRKRISLVSQEPCLFPGSIYFNIGLGAGADFKKEDVVRVSKMCGIHDFIMSLPDGYETDCGMNGSQLSGGQKQRVALARALIRDPSILLLDEATSALDSHSEKLVKQAITTASKGRTCIAVAHRLASVQNADRIYVFGDGKIIESGKHDDLIALDGVYATMIRQQMTD